MISGLQPYPAMKDSGVPWLGAVPQHWAILPNRAVYSEVRERDRPDANMLSVTIAKGVIRQEVLLADGSKKDSSKLDKSAYKLVRRGDIAYNKMRAWQGAVGVSVYEGIVSPAYVVQRPLGNAVPRYLHYLLRTPAFAKEAERWSYGITSDMWSLRPEHFRMIYSCLPPLPEQAAIVRFLDHADRRIQRYIRAKQKLIKLLEEQKQAIIHRAVTRGLDPNVRLKPSGVEWLGEVPEHWAVGKLKYCLAAPLAYGVLKPDKYEGVDGVPIVRILDISQGVVRREHLEQVSPRQDEEFARTQIEPGDVIVSVVGTIGRAAVIPQNLGHANLSRALCRVQLNRSITPEFFYAYCSSKAFMDQVESVPAGTAQRVLNLGDLGQFDIAFPSREEQVAILEAITASTYALVKAQAAARRELELLREYRTRLIADVVTGKLDVREAAARLPDEVEEAETLEDDPAMDESEEPIEDESDAIPEEAEA